MPGHADTINPNNLPDQIEEDLEEEKRWQFWDMQDGYKYAHGEHDDGHGKAGEELPRRGIAPGLHMGLSVLMDVQEEEYYCPGTESVGFKVTLIICFLSPEPLLSYTVAVTEN